ncbi:MAG: hypothetical protein H0W99_05560 [Acidobacteria bacterium]|nr:hypothetical protein [Acidobacteriota bacterium]
MPAKKASKKTAVSRAGSKGSVKSSASNKASRAGRGASASRKAAAKKATKKASKKSTAKAPPHGVTATAGNMMVVNMIPRSLSVETHQDSEPMLAVNPANPQQMVASAFTRDPFGGPNAPVYVSIDGGRTWVLKSSVPSNVQTGDITLAYSRSGFLYSGILKRPGNLLLNILRTPIPTQANLMTVLSSRTRVDQPFVQTSVIANRDHVYVGNNDFNAPGGKTATVDVSASGGANTFTPARIERRSTGSAGQNGPQIRPTSLTTGTVYAVFYGWRAFSNNQVTSDVVVVRDDNRGVGANPFSALVDPSDGVAGMRVAKGVKFTWDDLLGQNRLGGDLAIVADPNNSKVVYIAWGDVQSATGYTLHLRRSTDGGLTWSPSDLRTVGRGKNPSLAFNTNSKLAFLYQQVTGSGASQRWVTKVERSTDGVNWNSVVLATVPANSPAPQFQPYIGDYDFILSVGKDFYGIFSANNTPDAANFPNGVTYQRNCNFNTRQLLDLNNQVVPASIDPYFFKLTE